jgi:hypothetical protein
VRHIQLTENFLEHSIGLFQRGIIPKQDNQEAWHMPRALATFRAAGWNVTPYPADFRTGTITPWTEYSLVDSLLRWQPALREWARLVAYRVAGRA